MRACVRMFVCSCVFVCMCVRVYVRACVCVCVCIRRARVAWMFYLSKSKRVLGKELYWSAAQQSAIKSSHNAKFFSKKPSYSYQLISKYTIYIITRHNPTK